MKDAFTNDTLVNSAPVNSTAANTQLTHSDHRPSGTTFPLCLLAHNMEVPMNVGSLFRVADALGIEKIYLSGNSPTPPNTKIRKTSRSSEKHLPFTYKQDPLEIIHTLKQSAYTIVSLELSSHSVDIKDFSLAYDDKICLIIGSENKGIDQALLDESDTIVHIPMLGVNSSMNLATACAIASYEITKQFANLPTDRPSR